MRNADFRTALAQSGALQSLKAFDPHVVGTLPLDIAVDGSDIDIACHALDPVAFTVAVWTAFASFERFKIHQWVGSERPVVASMSVLGWDIEIFGSRLPVRQQTAWRHFDIERRLLNWGGPQLRRAVMRLRLSGLKTEPAFAAVLELTGDPYDALLSMQELPDDQLGAFMDDRRFGSL